MQILLPQEPRVVFDVPAENPQIREQPAYLRELASLYSGKFGIAVNQIINLAEALFHDNYHDRVLEVAGNIASAVCEKVIADAQGLYTYQTQWNGQMIFHGRPSEEVYQNAINASPEEVPDFERARNLANLQNLHALESIKRSGQGGFFVELSPSPQTETDEVRARGYDGRDSIFVYDLNKNDEIPVEQYWFNRAGLDEYNGLIGQNGTQANMSVLHDLAIKFPEVEIMGQFLYFRNKAQMDPVMKFIKNRQTKTSVAAANIVRREQPGLNARIWTRIPGLQRSAAAALERKGIDLVPVLNDLVEFIRVEQFRLRWLMNKEAGYNTFDAKLVKIQQSGGSFQDMLQKYIALGCSFSISGQVNQRNEFVTPPITSKAFDARDPVQCPLCTKVFYVKNGDSDTYEPICPNCCLQKLACD